MGGERRRAGGGGGEGECAGLRARRGCEGGGLCERPDLTPRGASRRASGRKGRGGGAGDRKGSRFLRPRRDDTRRSSPDPAPRSCPKRPSRRLAWLAYRSTPGSRSGSRTRGYRGLGSTLSPGPLGSPAGKVHVLPARPVSSRPTSEGGIY